MTVRVGIDVAGALAPSTGIGRYTSALYRALSGVEELELHPFCNARPVSPSLNPADRVANPRWPARLLHASWARFDWPSVERYTGPIQVFHTSDWSHPPLQAAARVTTVHDLGPVLHPEWYAPEVTAHHARHNKQTCQLSNAVVAISEYTRNSFLERYDVDGDRVVVVPNGVDPLFAPASAGLTQETRERFELEAPYLLYVGTRERRKNLAGLVDIFARLADEHPELKLAIVGARPWAEAKRVHGSEAWTDREVEERIKATGLQERVRILGALPLADLIALYTGAEVFVFPTLFEGFGLPVLEAMACGCPVVASAVTSLPEVVGDAGLLAAPQDPDAFAGAVSSILNDSHFRAELVSRGQVRAKAFTWANTAEATAEVYRTLALRGQS